MLIVARARAHVRLQSTRGGLQLKTIRFIDCRVLNDGHGSIVRKLCVTATFTILIIFATFKSEITLFKYNENIYLIRELFISRIAGKTLQFL